MNAELPRSRVKTSAPEYKGVIRRIPLDTWQQNWKIREKKVKGPAQLSWRGIQWHQLGLCQIWPCWHQKMLKDGLKPSVKAKMLKDGLVPWTYTSRCTRCRPKIDWRESLDVSTEPVYNGSSGQRMDILSLIGVIPRSWSPSIWGKVFQVIWCKNFWTLVNNGQIWLFVKNFGHTLLLTYLMRAEWETQEQKGRLHEETVGGEVGERCDNGPRSHQSRDLQPVLTVDPWSSRRQSPYMPWHLISYCTCVRV